MANDLDILGEASVYPGHMLTLAILIMKNFDSLDAAEARGTQFPAALESQEIPGAGGSVYAALDLLGRIRSGMTPDEAVEYARDHWQNARKSDHARHAQEGQEQADRFAPMFIELAEEWDFGAGPSFKR
jgi:hypothetical protein